MIHSHIIFWFSFLQNIPEILDIYENEFNKLSDRYFVEFPWPSADLVAPLVQKGMGAKYMYMCVKEYRRTGFNCEYLIIASFSYVLN